MSTTQWDRLIRYISARDGKVHYGEPIINEAGHLGIDDQARDGTLRVRRLNGSSAVTATATDEEDEVTQLLGPLTAAEVPIVRCIGLNYKTHIAEAGLSLPKYPMLFFKPKHTVADTFASIPIPKIGQLKCDYEGELTIVIGRDAKNVSEDDALDYVAGYVVGNDLSCRDWQADKEKAGAPQQFCFSKSFDQYAPLGPAIVSTEVLGECKESRIRTWVNDELRQDSSTAELVFGVRKLVSFLSMGQTLEAGSLIMTGTPGGIGHAIKPTPKYLQDGDEVVVEIEGIGKLRNTIKFE
ncbi:hypothetical protein FOVSG1_006632 [Fusarium oxysporum f. sp. vasinfectum]